LSQRLKLFVYIRQRADIQVIVNPMTLLKNPMILMGVAGLGLVFGMPYLMDSSMFPFQALSSPFLKKSKLIEDTSGSRDEEGIRRGAKEEPSKWSSSRPEPTEQF